MKQVGRGRLIVAAALQLLALSPALPTSFGAEDPPPATPTKDAMRQTKPGPAPPLFPQQVERRFQAVLPDAFMSQLMPTLDAGEKFVKAALENSGFNEDLADILAALNETSRNPFFLFGFDQPPVMGLGPQTNAWFSGKKSVAADSPQGQEGDEEVPLSPKKMFSRLLSFFSSFPTDVQAKPPAVGAQQQVQQEQVPQGQSPGGASNQSGSPPQDDMDDEIPPLRTWEPEDLDLM